MPRRALWATILLVLAIQWIGATALATTCFDPCPDDAPGTSCPPVCTLCAGCTHSQTAIVQHAAAANPLRAMVDLAAPSQRSNPAQLADDIFHVPLLG